MNTQHLCMSCMREIGDVKQCPYCGFYVDSPQMLPYLPLKTVISERYIVGKVLDSSGDGTTYMGWDIVQKSPVQIREFLPEAIVQRDQETLALKVMPGSEAIFRETLSDFLALWRKLVRMRGLSSLVAAYDIVEDNNTVYAIMEHVEGENLRDYLLRSKTGYLSWDKVRTLFMPILSTLGTLHSSGIIHRGISPHTLFIDNSEKLRITGFSIAQARTARGDLTAQLYPGYAAIEQYGFEGKQGPWTDIYAFAAVLYRSLIGSAPIEATSRVTNDKMMIPGKFVEEIPAYVINAMINALQILPEDRTHAVEEFRAELSATPSIASSYTNALEAKQTVQPERQQMRQKSAEKNNKTAVKAIAITLSAVLVLVGVLAFVFRDKWLKPKPEDDSSVSDNLSASGEFTIAQFEGRSGTEVISTAGFLKNYTFSIEEVYSDTIGAGLVISQTPAARSKVHKNEGQKINVILKVSKGPEKKKIPNVVGMKFEDAKKALEKEGFKDIVRADKLNDGTKQGGTVFSVTPKPSDELYDKKTKIYLQVWEEITSEEETTKFSFTLPTQEAQNDDE